MAIAFDNSSSTLNEGSTPATQTTSHLTGSGTDRYMLILVSGNNASMTQPTVTYNGVSAKFWKNFNATGVSNFFAYYLPNPDSGTHDCVVTQGATKAEYLTTHVLTYEGCFQGSPMNYEELQNSSSSSITISPIPEFDGAWTWAFGTTQASYFTTVSSATLREGAASTYNQVSMDSNAAVTAYAADDLTANVSASSSNGLMAGALYPSGATAIEHCVDDDTSFLAHMNGAVGNKSLDLENSTTDYVYIADGSQTGLDITGDFTVMGWFLWESEINGCGLVGKWNENGVNQRGWHLRFKNDGVGDRLILTTSSDGSSASEDYVEWSPGLQTFYHIAVAYDASAGTAELYVNGLPVGTFTGLDTSIYNNTADFSIGSYKGGSGYFDSFDGKVDDIKIYDDIRTIAEIRADMYQVTDDTTSENLQGHWQFDGALTDRSGNTNTLSHSGTPAYSEIGGLGKSADEGSGFGLYEENSPTASAGFDGEANGAYSLNGSTQGLKTGVDYTDYEAQAITVEGWFKTSTNHASTAMLINVNDTTQLTFQLYSDGTDYIFRVRAGASNYSSPGIAKANVEDGEWHYLVGTYDGSNVRLYIDAVEEDSGTSASGNLNTSNPAPLGIGYRPDGSDLYWTGDVDEVKISKRAKAPEEIAKYYLGVVNAKIYTSDDTYVKSNSPSSNYGSVASLPIYRSGTYQQEGLMKFNTLWRVPAEISILAGDFYAWWWNNSVPVDLNRVTADWEEDVVTYTSFASAYTETGQIETTPTLGSMTATDISSFIENWLDGTWDNYGFHINKSNVDTTGINVYTKEESGKEPYIWIEYSEGQTDVPQTVQSKARVIQEDIDTTIQAKSRVQKTGEPTIQAKAYIHGEYTKTIQAKAALSKVDVEQSVQSKARVQFMDLAKTITAKAKVIVSDIPKTIQAKSHIWESREGFVSMRNYDQDYNNSMSDDRILE